MSNQRLGNLFHKTDDGGCDNACAYEHDMNIQKRMKEESEDEHADDTNHTMTLQGRRGKKAAKMTMRMVHRTSPLLSMGGGPPKKPQKKPPMPPHWGGGGP